MKLHYFGRLADAVILSSGWGRRLIAFAAGAIGVLALPPFGLFPLIAAPLTTAVWLIDGAVGRGATASPRRSQLSAAWDAAKTGWWLGFGYFCAGLWWLGAAFLVEADQFAWALPLGVVGLPAVLAIFTGLGFGLSRLIWSTGAARVLALAAGLGLSEWLRSTVLTGFPWNNFGMAFGGNLVLAQVASLIGLHGLTVLCIGVGAAPALLADRVNRKLAVLVAFVVLAASSIFGAMRLATAETHFDPTVRLRIMQPNLPQDDKFRPEAMPDVLTRYLALSGKPPSGTWGTSEGFTHLIWPESPFPVILSQDASALQQIGDFLAPQGTLITGAARVEISSDRTAKYFNSIQVVRPGGVIVDSYDKTHLVPFGEYLPFRRVFDALGLRQFVHIPGGFEAGASRAVLRAPGFPPSVPLICYEAIFPGAATSAMARSLGAAVLLNVTNDGWFGNTPGPSQHFAQARLRAIEEGLPLVRSANTGISAIVDPYGRILGSLPLGVEGVLDGSLPRPADATVFSAHPFLAPFLFWMVVLLGALGSGRIRRRSA